MAVETTYQCGFCGVTDMPGGKVDIAMMIRFLAHLAARHQLSEPEVAASEQIQVQLDPFAITGWRAPSGMVWLTESKGGPHKFDGPMFQRAFGDFPGDAVTPPGPAPAATETAVTEPVAPTTEPKAGAPPHALGLHIDPQLRQLRQGRRSHAAPAAPPAPPGPKVPPADHFDPNPEEPWHETARNMDRDGHSVRGIAKALQDGGQNVSHMRVHRYLKSGGRGGPL